MYGISVRKSVARTLSILSHLFILVSPAVAFELEDPCAEASNVPLNASSGGFGGSAGEPSYFEIEVPEPGWVLLDVSTPGFSPVEARLGPADHDCAVSPGAPPRVIERSPTRWIFWAPAADTFFFRVAAQDPSARLQLFAVTTGFAPAEKPDSRPVKDEDDGVIEVDPDAKSEELNKDEDDGVIEVDPDAKDVRDVVLSPAARSSLHKGLCRADTFDDHGNLDLCATRLGPQTLVGVVENGRGDDEDYFELRVSRLQTVILSTQGETDTFGSLYDDRGYRLATDDDGGEHANFRIVKTLRPGVYFLKIEGSRAAEGPYEVQMQEAAW